MEKMKLGNGLWERPLFNTRLQPSEIGLSASPTNFTDTTQYLKWRVNYSYVTSAGSGRDNNGNLRSQMISAPGFAASLVQSYKYDQMNRISSAQETQNGAVKWTQAFSYDRFGNRRIVAASTTSSLRGLNPSISSTNNRINATGYEYDEAGNLMRTPVTATTSHIYGYDGENRMATYDGGGASYSYDGDGRRVKTQVGEGSLRVTTLYVYNAMGQMVAEYNNSSQGVDGGRQYLTQDHLGSTRVVSKENKEIKARYDYLPFGEEVGAVFSGRASVKGYNNIILTKQKFTSKERDAETGLDYFGARYYGSATGRFTSADPLLSSGEADSPQSWNRYSYTLNNPLKYTDPLGLYVFDDSVTLQQRDKFNAAIDQARANLTKLGQIYGLNSKEYKAAFRALEVYGEKGVDNGVKIVTEEGVGAGSTLVDGVAGRKTDTNPTGQKIQVRFDAETYNTDLFQSVVGHEGSHAAQGSEWVKSGFADSKHPNWYQSEVSALTVQSLLIEAQYPNSMGGNLSLPYAPVPKGYVPYPPLSIDLYNASWKTADKETLRRSNIDLLLARPTDKGGTYGLKPGDTRKIWEKGYKYP